MCEHGACARANDAGMRSVLVETRPDDARMCDLAARMRELGAGMCERGARMCSHDVEARPLVAEMRPDADDARGDHAWPRPLVVGIRRVVAHTRPDPVRTCTSVARVRP